MINRIVPAFEVGAFEAVRGRCLSYATVPFADQPQPVAGCPESLGEGELAVGQILDVADIALAVGQQLVPERCGPGEQ